MKIPLNSSENEMSDFVRDFYRDLTPFYHLLYPDWDRSIQRQASMLQGIIQDHWGEGGSEILDASCGIGTQSLGLAGLGYRVTASDLSPQAVERARQEAALRGLEISFRVADLRSAFEIHSREFDVVIACDNSIPHLLTDREILAAFRQLLACTRPGGGCLISVRDYDVEDRTGNPVKVYGAREQHGSTTILFQNWTWDPGGEFYDLSLYLVEDDGGPQCRTRVMRSKYYAVGIGKLLDLMTQAGFSDVARLDGAFFQPVLVGTRPS